jgi:DNA-3-methyladenine glycosylase
MNFDPESQKLTPDFFQDNVIKVAKSLLGKIFVKRDENTLLAGKIVEVEAYDGVDDEACHCYRGMTERNKVMFMPGGRLYVYFTYGAHFCCNVVTGKEGFGAAVLLRGIEPVEGSDIMAYNRYGVKDIDKKKTINLTNGPGKICRAFGIDRAHNGIDLTGNKIYILNSALAEEKDILVSERIGIKKSVELPWRFYLNNNFVSKK